ncbi:MAG: hypothetical protein R3E65_06065 [Steroidobacteraceae bacterium]
MRALRQIRQSFNWTYWPYVRDVHYRQQMAAPVAYLKAARHSLEWAWRLRRRDARNPLFVDQAAP